MPLDPPAVSRNQPDPALEREIGPRPLGHHDEARGILAAARTRLEQQASRLHDPALRNAFLEDVAEHAALMARAREWCGEG